MTTTFYMTRDKAKKAAKELNGKFKDFGKDSPKGERWAVLIEDTTHNPTRKRKLRTGTKADKVRHIVQTMINDENVRPRDIIQTIMDRVGFKKRAAITYYYNAKRQLGLN